MSVKRSPKAVLRRSIFVFCLLFSSVALADELAGTWILSIDTPRGVQHPTLVIRQTDEVYSGVYNSLRGPIVVDTITVDGNNFAFPLVITVPIGDINVNYTGSINGDDMTGSVQNPRGAVPFTGKRSSS
ncbi:MAG: hypothetical protein VB949_12155 [Pseudomonadales bacterium]|jgi:hypothetical protein